ncbi:unnamed protein product [Closterium sp. Naga37s-1]|nr:unnamed protein product [Closterium sp. Naga37s-1]
MELNGALLTLALHDRQKQLEKEAAEKGREGVSGDRDTDGEERGGGGGGGGGEVEPSQEGRGAGGGRCKAGLESSPGIEIVLCFVAGEGLGILGAALQQKRSSEGELSPVLQALLRLSLNNAGRRECLCACTWSGSSGSKETPSLYPCFPPALSPSISVGAALQQKSGGGSSEGVSPVLQALLQPLLAQCGQARVAARVHVEWGQRRDEALCQAVRATAAERLYVGNKRWVGGDQAGACVGNKRWAVRATAAERLYVGNKRWVEAAREVDGWVEGDDELSWLLCSSSSSKRSRKSKPRKGSPFSPNPAAPAASASPRFPDSHSSSSSVTPASRKAGSSGSSSSSAAHAPAATAAAATAAAAAAADAAGYPADEHCYDNDGGENDAESDNDNDYNEDDYNEGEDDEDDDNDDDDGYDAVCRPKSSFTIADWEAELQRVAIGQQRIVSLWDRAEVAGRVRAGSAAAALGSPGGVAAAASVGFCAGAAGAAGGVGAGRGGGAGAGAAGGGGGGVGRRGGGMGDEGCAALDKAAAAAAAAGAAGAGAGSNSGPVSEADRQRMMRLQQQMRQQFTGLQKILVEQHKPSPVHPSLAGGQQQLGQQRQEQGQQKQGGRGFFPSSSSVSGTASTSSSSSKGGQGGQGGYGKGTGQGEKAHGEGSHGDKSPLWKGLESVAAGLSAIHSDMQAAKGSGGRSGGFSGGFSGGRTGWHSHQGSEDFHMKANEFEGIDTSLLIVPRVGPTSASAAGSAAGSGAASVGSPSPNVTPLTGPVGGRGGTGGMKVARAVSHEQAIGGGRKVTREGGSKGEREGVRGGLNLKGGNRSEKGVKGEEWESPPVPQQPVVVGKKLWVSGRRSMGSEGEMGGGVEAVAAEVAAAAGNAAAVAAREGSRDGGSCGAANPANSSSSSNPGMGSNEQQAFPIPLPSSSFSSSSQAGFQSSRVDSVDCHRFPPDQILRATGGFSPSQLIGRGRLGPSYRGEIFGCQVAIKLLTVHEETSGRTDKNEKAEKNAVDGAQGGGKQEERVVEADGAAVASSGAFGSFGSSGLLDPSTEGGGQVSRERVQAAVQSAVDVLRRLRHPHLLLLMGHCPEYPCLVYEFAPGGSLSSRLSRIHSLIAAATAAAAAAGDGGGGAAATAAEEGAGNSSSSAGDGAAASPSGERGITFGEEEEEELEAIWLSWVDRLRLASELAGALLFMHQHSPPVLHGAVTLQNVLLDRNSACKLSGAGLSFSSSPFSGSPGNSSSASASSSNPSSSTAVGVEGPCQHGSSSTGVLSDDVHAYGIVVLQLVTGITRPSLIHSLMHTHSTAAGGSGAGGGGGMDGHRAESAGEAAGGATEGGVSGGGVSWGFNLAEAVDVFLSRLDVMAGEWPVEMASVVVLLALRCASGQAELRPDLAAEVQPALSALAREAEESFGRVARQMLRSALRKRDFTCFQKRGVKSPNGFLESESASPPPDCSYFRPRFCLSSGQLMAGARTKVLALGGSFASTLLLPPHARAPSRGGPPQLRGGVPALPPITLSEPQERYLKQLQTRIQPPFENDKEEHRLALVELWEQAYPGRVLTEEVEVAGWKEMGWQGKNPASDFRGGGFFALENLVYYARTYPVRLGREEGKGAGRGRGGKGAGKGSGGREGGKGGGEGRGRRSFQRIMYKQEGRRVEWEYPFGAAGVNITVLLISILDLRKDIPATVAGRAFLKMLPEHPTAFEDLYCGHASHASRAGAPHVPSQLLISLSPLPIQSVLLAHHPLPLCQVVMQATRAELECYMCQPSFCSRTHSAPLLTLPPPSLQVVMQATRAELERHMSQPSFTAISDLPAFARLTAE